MTSTDATTTKPVFGVSERLGETFSILRQRFMTFVLLSAVPGIVAQLATLAVGLGVNSAFSPSMSGAGATSQSFGLIIFVSGVLPLFLYSIMTGTMVMAAYDTKAGRPVRFSAYLIEATRRLPALIFVTIVASVGIGVGSMLFLVPGLWIIGVWAVCVPVIMIEGLGFGALGRSSRLTKEYRWPIVGFLIVAYIITSVITVLVAFVAAWLPVPGVMVAIVIGLINGVTTALISIAISVVYARLRDIKEGVGYADLAEVFD